MGHILISCAVILYDDQHRVLITRRSDEARNFPGLWETPGGGLEFGETPEVCARREMWEELGCGITDLALFRVYSWIDDHRQLITIVFTGKADRILTLNHREIAEYRWVSADEVSQYQFCLNCKERVVDFFSSIC